MRPSRKRGPAVAELGEGSRAVLCEVDGARSLLFDGPRLLLLLLLLLSVRSLSVATRALLGAEATGGVVEAWAVPSASLCRCLSKRALSISALE